MGDLLGALVVAPVLLVWVTAPAFLANRRSYIEGAVQLTSLALISWYVFGNQPPVGIFHQALLYVIFPFTIWAAYAAFEEDIKGSITPRKLADMVVFSKDIMKIPPKELLETKALLTIIGGKIVYQAESWK